MSRNGLLQQQLPQVYGKYIDGLLLCFFRQFVPDLPLNGGKDQALVGIGAGFCVHLGERVSFFYLQETVQFRQHFFFRVIQRKLQVFQLFPPVQGQGAVGRKLPHRFAVLFVHKEVFAGSLVCGKDGRQLGVLPQDPADQGPYVGPVRNGFRYNILGPFPGIAFRFHAFFSIDKRRRQFGQAPGRVCLQHNVAGQGFQSLFPGNLGPGTFLRPVGQVQVLQYLHLFRRHDLPFQFRRQLFLFPDGIQDLFTALVQVPQVLGPGFQSTDLLFVQGAGGFFTVPSDEGDGVASVQQLQGGFRLGRFNI